MSSQDRNEPSFTATVIAPDNTAYHEEPPPPRSGRRRLFGVLAAVAALSGFAGIAWYATSEGQRDPSAVVPVITADTTPIKERPQDPGGLDIPNRGMEVFSQITPGTEPQRVERLLPPAEAPVARPAPPAGPLVPDAPAIRDRAALPAVVEAPPGPPPAPPAVTGAQEVAKAPVAPAAIPPKEPAKEAAKKEAPRTAALPKAPAPAAPNAASVGGWQVQLGAAREQNSANAAVQRIATANKDILGGLRTSVVRADLGAKGTFYRMRVGPLKDRAAADDLCGKLKARKVGCLVVSP